MLHPPEVKVVVIYSKSDTLRSSLCPAHIALFSLTSVRLSGRGRDVPRPLLPALLFEARKTFATPRPLQ